jgi:hypothetical protein
MKIAVMKTGHVIISGAVITVNGCGLFSFCPNGALA